MKKKWIINIGIILHSMANSIIGDKKVVIIIIYWIITLIISVACNVVSRLTQFLFWLTAVSDESF